MKEYSIASIAGDGIGKEVVPEAQKILKEISKQHQFKLNIKDYDFASCDYYEKHGKMMPDDWKEKLTKHDAIFFGAVGMPDKYPTKTIIAGNVVTADMTQELILSGADIVKVGIGPGSVCTTRIQTGVGYPQLSAVIECADAAHGLGAHIIADGGCTCPGDVAKAFGGGADFVMLGGMFAGHDEGKGKLVKSNGSKYVEFYGSSSETANNKHYGGLSDYRSSEGRTVRVKYRGKINDTILNILGGVRSSCTYVGAPSLKQLSKCTTFVRVTKQFNDTFTK